MDIQAVSIKLPTFWTSCPEAWFCHAEAQFAIRKITEENTQYHYVVASLDSDTANRALSVLNAPPATGKYQTLKDFLLSAFKLSESERAAALFSLNGLGDSKPSELMDKMLALISPHEPCFLFRYLFMQQLPEFVRVPLSNSSESDCRKLALQADLLYISGGKGQAVSTVDVSSPPGAQAVSSRPQALCWYHSRFGKKAKRCMPSCARYTRFNQGKLPGGPTVDSATAGPTNSQLIIQDNRSGIQFLIDTGHRYLLYPPRGATGSNVNQARH